MEQDNEQKVLTKEEFEKIFGLDALPTEVKTEGPVNQEPKVD